MLLVTVIGVLAGGIGFVLNYFKKGDHQQLGSMSHYLFSEMQVKEMI
jgi:hypothetical protein